MATAIFSHLLPPGAPHLGAVIIPVDEVVSGQKIEGWFHLVGPTATKKHGKPMQAQVCQALFNSICWPQTSSKHNAWTILKGSSLIIFPSCTFRSKLGGPADLMFVGQRVCHHMSKPQPALIQHLAWAVHRLSCMPDIMVLGLS